MCMHVPRSATNDAILSLNERCHPSFDDSTSHLQEPLQAPQHVLVCAPQHSRVCRDCFLGLSASKEQCGS
jgi:hypothetical protein